MKKLNRSHPLRFPRRRETLVKPRWIRQWNRQRENDHVRLLQCPIISLEQGIEDALLPIQHPIL